MSASQQEYVNMCGIVKSDYVVNRSGHLELYRRIWAVFLTCHAIVVPMSIVSDFPFSFLLNYHVLFEWLFLCTHNSSFTCDISSPPFYILNCTKCKYERSGRFCIWTVLWVQVERSAGGQRRSAIITTNKWWQSKEENDITWAIDWIIRITSDCYTNSTTLRCVYKIEQQLQQQCRYRG